MQPILLSGEPPELLLYDQPEECPYLSGRTARMPMRLPLRRLAPAETDRHLAIGDRRHGRLLYRTECPECRACEPIRLDIGTFRPSRTQARVKRRGDVALSTRIVPPGFSPERLALYEKHKRGRDLITESSTPLGERGYRGFLVDQCVDAFELQYRLEDRLVGVAIADRGASSLSAVYCFYDPDYPKLSIGTYSILKQMELLSLWGMQHLYLGLFIADNAHMRYKASFLPHERRVDGEWRTYEQPREVVAPR